MKKDYSKSIKIAIIVIAIMIGIITTGLLIEFAKGIL